MQLKLRTGHSLRKKLFELLDACPEFSFLNASRQYKLQVRKKIRIAVKL